MVSLVRTLRGRPLTGLTLARVLALLLALAVLLALAPPAVATHDVAGDRISGTDRFDTAATLAEANYPDGTATALIARADQFADALAGSYAAGQLDAPVLLSNREEVPERTWTALEDLGIGSVVLLGGRAALTEDVEDELRDRGYTVDRVEGVDRFQTAAAIANTYGQAGMVGELGGLRTAIVAAGGGFADALAASPLAAGADLPLLLTERERTNVAMNSVLDQLEIEQVLIAGGTAAVSQDVQDELAARGFAVVRVSGPNRMATAAEMGRLAVEGFGWSPVLTLLARGDNFPDALAAAPYAGAAQAPLVLAASPTILSGPTEGWLLEMCPDVSDVRAIGGEAALSPGVLAEAAEAAGRCHAPEDQTYIVAPQEAQTAEPGFTYELSVAGRYDGERLTGPVELVLFPCRNVDALDRPKVFQDETGNGLADGIATTNTNAAVIDSVHGQATNGRYLTGAVSNGDGVIPFTVTSDEPDCAVALVFDDENANNQLDVDGQGRPTEPFGLTQVAWS